VDKIKLINMSKLISKEEIESGIPQDLKPFLLVHLASDIEPEFENTIKAFWMAVEHFRPAVRLWRQVFVVFGSSPFTVTTPTGGAAFVSSERCVNFAMDAMVFIDCPKMAVHEFDFQVLAVLEELAHTFLNIKDEDLVTRVCCHLYPEAHYQDGRYGIRPETGGA
jgi:hypothetical protein